MKEYVTSPPLARALYNKLHPTGLWGWISSFFQRTPVVAAQSCDGSLSGTSPRPRYSLGTTQSQVYAQWKKFVVVEALPTLRLSSLAPRLALNGRPPLHASEDRLQAYANTRIIPIVSRQGFNRVVDTHNCAYLVPAATSVGQEPGECVKPDLSSVPHGSVLSTASVNTPVDLKVTPGAAGYSASSKGQLLSYLFAILAQQRSRAEAVGAITDLHTVIFIGIRRVSRFPPYEVWETRRLSLGESGDEPGNRYLYALLASPHPLCDLSFRPIPLHTEIFPGPALRGIHPGHLSQVYLVGEPQAGSRRLRQYALKVVSDPYLCSREVISLKLVAQSTQSNIIRLVGASQNALLLEPVASCTARELFTRETSIEQVQRNLKLLAPIVCALQHCHGVGVLHRDCRGANILVCETPHRKFLLSDFGCSSADDEK
eukprot:m.91032 g.91032  ORF g.91032 m.91032 type:complete len:429 (+) comp8484_c0_seq4:196-1482(+)